MLGIKIVEKESGEKGLEMNVSLPNKQTNNNNKKKQQQTTKKKTTPEGIIKFKNTALECNT